MKIYALVYKYKTMKDGETYNNIRLIHHIDESLENIILPAEKEIMEEKGYIENSLTLDLKSIMSLDDVLDDIEIKLPELVKSAKQRKRLTVVAEALKSYDDEED